MFDFKHKDRSNPNVKLITINDLSEELNIKKAFAQITPSRKKYFIFLVLVGGFYGGKNIWETEIGYFDRMINMNLKTSFLIAKYFLYWWKDSHSGSICLTAAYTGLDAEAGKAAYGISKAGVIHLIKTLSEEVEKINLSANAIAPYH